MGRRIQRVLVWELRWVSVRVREYRECNRCYRREGGSSAQWTVGREGDIESWAYEIQICQKRTSQSSSLLSLPLKVEERRVVCETYLTSIREFSPNNPPSSHIQICIVQNNRGTLTTQLQSDRSQMFRRSFTDDFTNVSRTSVENMIELKFEEGRGLVDRSGYTDVGLRVEVFGEESGD